MKDFDKLISYLLHSRTQAHAFHLQTKSYAEHVALNGYYDGIVALIDGLVESYQGKHGMVDKYSNFELESYRDNAQLIKYFESLGKMVEKIGNSISDRYLQNQIDTITELIYSTTYKLKFLS